MSFGFPNVARKACLSANRFCQVTTFVPLYLSLFSELAPNSHGISNKIVLITHKNTDKRSSPSSFNKKYHFNRLQTYHTVEFQCSYVCQILMYIKWSSSGHLIELILITCTKLIFKIFLRNRFADRLTFCLMNWMFFIWHFYFKNRSIWTSLLTFFSDFPLTGHLVWSARCPLLDMSGSTGILSAACFLLMLLPLRFFNI